MGSLPRVFWIRCNRSKTPWSTLMTQFANTFAALTLLLASLLLPATSAAQKDQPSPPTNNSVYAELAKSPKKAAARRNPLADDPDAIAAGAKLFAQHCAEC